MAFKKKGSKPVTVKAAQLAAAAMKAKKKFPAVKPAIDPEDLIDGGADEATEAE